VLEDKLKMSNFKSEHQKALLNMYYTVSLMLNNERAFLSAFDLTSQQYNVLKILKGQNRNPISLKEIRARMLDKHSDIGRIVKRLELKGHIEKQVSQFDKRAFSAIISKKGEAVLKDIDKHKLEEWNTGITKLTAADAQDLNRLLDKINK